VGLRSSLVIKNVLEGAGIGADARAEIHLLAFLLQLQVLEGLLVAGVGVEVVQVQQVRACRCLPAQFSVSTSAPQPQLQLSRGNVHPSPTFGPLDHGATAPQLLSSSGSPASSVLQIPQPKH